MSSSLSSLPSRALTITEARKILHISKPTIYELIRSGTLPAFRVGRDWRVSEETLRAFIKGGDK